MGSLYKILQVEKNCTLETIERNYKILAYKHSSSSNHEELEKLNVAFYILKDKYKREYYDRFGDEHINALKRPMEGYLYSRLLTTVNLFLCLYYVSFNILNFVFLIYLFKIFNLNHLRFSPSILSQIFLLLILNNVIRLFKSFKKELRIIYNIINNTLVIHIITFILILYSDKIINKITSLWLLIIIQSVWQGIFIINYFKELRFKLREITFRIIGSSCIFLYFVDSFKYKIFIPSLICLFTSIIHIALGIIIGIPVLIYTIALYCSILNRFNILVHFIGIIYIISTLISFFYIHKSIIRSRNMSNNIRINNIYRLEGPDNIIH